MQLDGPQRVVGAVRQPELHGTPEGGRIATHGLAMLVEHVAEPLDRRDIGISGVGGRRLRGDPDIGAPRDDAQPAPLAVARQPQRWMRLLHRLRVGHGVRELVVRAGERGARLRPQRRQHLARFVEPLHPLTRSQLRHAEHGLDVGVTAGAESQIEPSTADVVDGDGHLGQHAGVPVGIAGDERADAYSPSRLCHRGERRPGLEDVTGALASHRGEVVEQPAAVESTVVGDRPHLAQCVDADMLLGRLQAERKWLHLHSY